VAEPPFNWLGWTVRPTPTSQDGSCTTYACLRRSACTAVWHCQDHSTTSPHACRRAPQQDTPLPSTALLKACFVHLHGLLTVAPCTPVHHHTMSRFDIGGSRTTIEVTDQWRQLGRHKSFYSMQEPRR
jgi:hypothetical protein